VTFRRIFIHSFSGSTIPAVTLLVLLGPEDEVIKIIRNVARYEQFDKVLHFKQKQLFSVLRVTQMRGFSVYSVYAIGNWGSVVVKALRY
jgi:hypothetical protein